MSVSVDPNVMLALDSIQKLASSDIEQLVKAVIPSDRVPGVYLASLNAKDRDAALRACLLCWIITSGTQCPREIQLQSCLAVHNQRDCLIHSGTGTGKTLPIVLNILLNDPAKDLVYLTLSPLKRLQKTQTNDFRTTYGITTVAINDETPHDDKWWREWIYDPKKQKLGKARHIIATIEQLFKNQHGHVPPLGRHIINYPAFRKCIAHVNIDECHFIHTAGSPQYGKSAFRPGWFRLPELRAAFPRELPWRVMSATPPPHILKTASKQILWPDYDTIVGPLN